MKQLELELCEDAEPRRGRKVYDQKIYVSALERGSRDRSPRPRQIEPLPDRIELKICPQKNHRGRMNYYRTRSIPELCRITLTPSGENSFQQDEMKEVYFTQYTHSFGQEIEKPLRVAWKRAFEDGDVAQTDSKLCMVNSPVGSKPDDYPERRKSAPPGSFVFNYDALDIPEPVHRRSKSLGLAMDNPLHFDQMDFQVSAHGMMNVTMEESRTSGNMRPLAHEMITAQKVEQVQSVDSSFWDDTFDSFDVEENLNNSTHNGVRNGDVTAMADDDMIDGVTTGDVTTGDVTTDGVTADDVTTDGVTTGAVKTGAIKIDGLTCDGVKTDVFKRGRATSDYSSQNGFNLRYGEITHENDSASTQDPTKQALSLISTLRSSVRKPDSKTFLCSVHETSKTDLECKNKNRPSLKNQSNKPSDQDISYQSKVSLGTLHREFPQKVTPRIVSIPGAEFTHHTVRPYEVSPRKSLRQETSRKKLPQEIIPRKNEPQEDTPRVMKTQLGSQLNTESDPELKRKYISKSEAMIGGYSTSKPNYTTSRLPNDYRPDEKRKYETALKSEKIGNDTSRSRSELPTIDQVEIQSEESIPSFSIPPQTNAMFSEQFKTDMSPKQVKNHQLPSTTNVTLKQGTIGMENQNQVYYRAQNVKVLTKKTVEISTSNHQADDKRYNSQPARNLTSKQGKADQDEGSYQKPNVDVREKKTVDTGQSNHPQQIDDDDYKFKPRSTESPTSEQKALDKNEGYYQEPNVGKRRKIDTNQSNYLEQIDEKSYYPQPQSEEKPTSEQPEHGKSYQQHSAQVSRLKTFGNTGYSNTSKPTSSLSPELGATDQNEDYYQLPNSEARTFKTFGNTVYSNTSKPTSRLSPELEATDQNEDHYQSPNLEVLALKTVETKQSMSKQDGNAVYKKPLKSAPNLSRELEVTDQYQNNEEPYQQPNSRMTTLKTVEINQRSHSEEVDNTAYSKHFASNKTTEQLTPEEEEQYYRQPSPEVWQTEVRHRPLKNGEVRSNVSKFIGQTPERGTPEENEPYYQQPTFQVKATCVPENLYQEPKDSTLSSSKCPLDQHNNKDFKKQLPETPQEQDTSQNVYEIPKDTSPSSMKCPLDRKPEDNNRSGNYDQPHDHVYEQVDFPRKRIYEQHKYETMKPPQSRFYEQTDSVYEQPSRNCYENFKVNTRPSHADVGYVAVTAPQHKIKTEEPIYEQPRTEFLSSVASEGLMRSEVPARLRTAQLVNGIENKNIKSTSYSMQAEVNYSKNTGSKYKQTDTKHRSTSSLRPTNEVEKDFKSNGPSTQVVYTGQSNKMKSVVSTTSSVRLDQSDSKISEGSPISRSASSVGDLLPQKPEVEVLNETPKMRDRSKARQPQDEEFSQPSIYSKASQSKASQSNTSLARFSSFNSEASYKRRLTSAWIEQQRMNFRKQVSREPSLRRTKSVEFYKERAPSENTADYQLKHSKSALSFEQLSSMYNPFEDKYFEPNPNKHRAKVVHASPSEVFTKAKSFEDRDWKVKESQNASQVNTSPNVNKDSLTITPLEQDAKQTNGEDEQQVPSMEGIVASCEVKPRRQPLTSNQRPKVPPKSADVSGFDESTYNHENRNFSMEENIERQDRMVTRDVDKSWRPRVRPKSADVSGFDVSTYNHENRHFSMEENIERQGRMVTRKVDSSGRPRVRPKSADVSGFDVSSFNDEPTLRQSKSEISVDQLKAMYDPYDQNAWFSTGPVLQNDNQSDPKQVDVTLDEVVHRRTCSEPESRLDKFKNARKQPESEIMKMKVENVEAEPAKSITKLNSQSVLVLNVVQPTEPKNPKFQRNPARKSTGSIVSVRTKEIENEKQLTMAEMKDAQRESRRRDQTEDHVVGKTFQDGKPVEKLRARYVTGGERSSVRYFSNSTDELTSNDATKKETLTQLQAQSMERPMKAPKKDSGFRNFFGKIRRAKSEPNLDTNFNILDIDSDHGGKLQRSENLKDDQQHFQETSPGNSQDKLQSSSRSGMKSWPFYPNFKNFKKNFSKSKQNKANGSFNDNGENSARDMAKSHEFLESSVLSESNIKRENVELSESQAGVVQLQNIQTTDSPASSQRIDVAKSNQSFTSQREELLSIVHAKPPLKEKETKPTSPTSPVTSPRSARERLFSGGNRITPVTVTNVDEREKNFGLNEGKTTSKVADSRSDLETITTDKVMVEKEGKTIKPEDIVVHRSWSGNAQNLSGKSARQNSRSFTAQTRSEIGPELHDDKVGYTLSQKESKYEESQERTKRYRMTEVTSRTITSNKQETLSDGNNSRFVDGFTRREDLNSTPNVSTITANKNSTAFSITSVTVKQNNEENHTKMNVRLSGQRNSFHENFLAEVNSEQAKDKESEQKDTTVCTYQVRDSTNNGLESKHEELHTKEGKEFKHRSFFATKLFTSSGKLNSSQSRVENESSLEEGSSGEKDDITTVNTNQDSMKIGNTNGLENSKTVVRKKGRETTSKKNDKREKADKEKPEFGTRIKGFLAKVLPQKDKNSTKEEIGKEETIAVKTEVEESERFPVERNNPATVVSVTSSSDERKVGDQRGVASTTTKPRRATFVVKHLGESDGEKTRASEDEGMQAKRGTVELVASNKNERRNGYSSKAKHMDDSRTVETKSLEKLSVKQSSVDERFTTLTNNERSTMQRDFQRNEVGEMDSSECFKSKGTVKSSGPQDEIITKTNVVDNVEAFDPVLDFFENAFNDYEKSNDDNGESLSELARLGRPVEIGRPKSNVMMTSSTMDAEKDFEVAGDSKSKTRRHEKQFGVGQDTSDNERATSLEQIKGFTITQVKASSVLLNKSKEDLNAVGNDNGGENIQAHFKHEDLNTKQGYSRNTKTQITQGKISVDNKALREPSQEDQKTTENSARDINKQQLKYVEKVMVSVHRGASEVERLVRDSTETSSIVESSDLYSCPVPKHLEHVGQSSTSVDENRNTNVVPTRGAAERQATITHSSAKTGFGNGPTSDKSSPPVSKLWQHVRSNSGEDEAKIVVTRDVPAKRLPPLNPAKNYAVTKRDKTQVANVNEGWGHVIDELVIKNTAETTNALNNETNAVDDSKRIQLNEEEVNEETTLKQLQPNDSSTPIQDSPNSLLSNSGGTSQTLNCSSSKSLEVVDRTDGYNSLDIKEMKTFGTSRSEAMATGQLNSKTQSPHSISNSLVKTTEVKPPSPSNLFPQTKIQTRTSNFEEQQRQSIERTITSLKQNHETVVGTKITRPKSSLHKESKKNIAVVSTFYENATKDMTVSSTPTEIEKYESKNESLNDVSKKYPPPVLPKPKRTKGKEISPVKIADVKHEIIQQRKPVDFLDVQNNNHSFADFQWVQENINGNAVKGEQTIFHSSQRYQADEISRQRFVCSRVTSAERKNVSSSVTMKQLKNERIATSETFKQLKNGEDPSETESQMERNKEKSLNTSKQRKQRGTTGSETSEDLAVRLQRLLCEDDSMSEPEDSSVTHEISSAVYSFSEDSAFDTNLMDQRYKSLEKVRKVPATAKVPKTSHISMDESSDEDVFRRNTKLNYKMHSKTL